MAKMSSNWRSSSLERIESYNWAVDHILKMMILFALPKSHDSDIYEVISNTH